MRKGVLRHYGAVTVFKIGVVATTTTVYKVSHVDIMMNFHDWHLQGGAAKSGKKRMMIYQICILEIKSKLNIL